MMIRALSAAVVLTAAPALAQDIPDMKGIWVSTENIALVRGSGTHFTDPDADLQMIRSTSQDFTITIEKQDGRAFWGKIVSPADEEEIGVILEPDLEHFVGIDSDGYFRGRLTGPGTLELCYQHVGAGRPVAIVACSSYEKRDE